MLERLAVINHPHIVKYIDFIEDCCGLLFEYCEGGSLRSVLSKKRLSVEQAVLMGIQVADALEAAYRIGLIAHRDIKPENILFDEKGVLKVSRSFIFITKNNLT